MFCGDCSGAMLVFAMTGVKAGDHTAEDDARDIARENPK